MVKTLQLNEVKLGMCLAETVKNKYGKELYKANFYFTSREQIIDLLDNGIRSVQINIALSLPDSSEEGQTSKKTHIITEKIDPVQRYEQMVATIEEVKELCDTGDKIVKELMLATRYGKALDKKSIVNEAQKILNLISRDPHVALALLDLKNFDEYTYIHSVNVAFIAVAFALHLRFSQDKVLSIAQGSILHDIGKAKLSTDIINKPDKLTDEEIQIVQKHPALGKRVIEDDNIDDPIITEIVLSHHENYDGTGYPSKYKGNEMKRYAAIISVADFYDALTTKRSYKEAFEPAEAVKLIYNSSGTKFDPRVVNHFIKVLGIYPIGSIVELSDGHIAIVISFTPETLLKPVVKTLYHKRRPSTPKEIFIDLARSRIYIKEVYKDKTFKVMDIIKKN
jgi:HD-GYP domain-containing protein (c-di-GMP phosphodiesterase class II)